MAKLNGIIRLEGTLQDLTFYKTQDGHLVKTKSGVSGDRIANDPAFVRTRENGAEFGTAAKAGKVMRDTFRLLIQNASDNRVTSRVTQLMSRLQHQDTTSPRGERKVSLGLATTEGQNLAKSFNFNNGAILGSILLKPYSVDTTTGIITIGDLVPSLDIKAVAGATHVSLLGVYAVINFDTAESEIQFSDVENLPIDSTSTSVILTPASMPTIEGTKFFLLEIIYLQEVNGTQYLLNNGGFNALSIIDVETPVV